MKAVAGFLRWLYLVSSAETLAEVLHILQGPEPTIECFVKFCLDGKVSQKLEMKLFEGNSGQGEFVNFARASPDADIVCWGPFRGSVIRSKAYTLSEQASDKENGSIRAISLSLSLTISRQMC